MSIIADAHDIHCNCTEPFCHLLDSIFPEGHKDRKLTVEAIIQRGKQQCHFGGEEETDGGMAIGTSAATQENTEIKQEEGATEEEDIEGLLAAVADAEER